MSGYIFVKMILLLHGSVMETGAVSMSCGEAQTSEL